MSEQVNHPSHYNSYSVEVIEMFRRIYGDDATALWCEMTALKYRMRMGLKEGNPIEQDFAKEQFYLNKMKELKLCGDSGCCRNEKGSAGGFVWEYLKKT